MNAARLLEHFEQISDAADAVPSLRRFVLDLAVRGKLTRHFSSAKHSIGDSRPKSFDADIWSIPDSWKFVQLQRLAGEVGLFVDGDWVESKDQDPTGPIRLTQLADVGVGVFRDRSSRFMNAETAKRLGCTFLEPNDVLIARMPDPLGRACLFPGDSRKCVTVVDVAVLRIDPKAVSPAYVVHAINSPLFAKNVGSKAAGTTRSRISRGNLAKLPFPVPPLAEQERIVAKVDELMALCDRLEAAQVEREARRDRLVAASLARVSQPAADDAASDARAAGFHLDHFARLTTRPEHVKQLRQTILNLAVRGRLVPQDPTDTSAIALRDTISAAKASLRKTTADPRIKASPPPSSSLPFEIPPSWAIESFENLFLFIDYRGKTPPKTSEGVPLITAKNIRMGFLNREPREFISPKTFSGWMTRGFPRLGDLFFTTEAPLANVCRNNIDEPFGLAQRVVCLQPYGNIDTTFVMYAIMSKAMQSLIDVHASGTTARGIKTAKLKPLPIPLPPLAEQRRIVAKVDELMALCDQLEASLAAAATDRARLLESLLHEALAPAA